MLFFNNIFLSQRLIKFFTILVVLLSLLSYNQKRNYYSGKFSAFTSLSSTIRLRPHQLAIPFGGAKVYRAVPLHQGQACRFE